MGNRISFEQLCDRSRAAVESEYFTWVPQEVQTGLTRFIANQFIVSDEAHRYRITRWIQIVEAKNREISRQVARDTREPRNHNATRHTGKTQRTKAQRSGYNCPCVRDRKTKLPIEGMTGCSSKRDHDVKVRSAMRSAKGSKS